MSKPSKDSKDPKLGKLFEDITSDFQENSGTGKVDLIDEARVSLLEKALQDLKNGGKVDQFKASFASFVGDSKLSLSRQANITGLVSNYLRSDKKTEKLADQIFDDSKAQALSQQISSELAKAKGDKLTNAEINRIDTLSRIVAGSDKDNSKDGEVIAHVLAGVTKGYSPEDENIKKIQGMIKVYHRESHSATQGVVGAAVGDLKKSSEPGFVPSKTLSNQIVSELETIKGGKKLSRQEFEVVKALNDSVVRVGDKDGANLVKDALTRVVKGYSFSQVEKIFDLVADYHKNDPAKKELVENALGDIQLKPAEPAASVSSPAATLDPAPTVDPKTITTTPGAQAATISPKEAHDSAAVSTPPAGQVSDDFNKAVSIPSTEPDEIIKAIRKQVLAEQQKYLQGKIAPDQSLEEMRAWLATDEGKAKLSELMKTKEAQEAMNEIEAKGYKKIHQADFKNVNWSKGTGPKVSIAKIERDGVEVASLTETTRDIEPPQQVKLEDGSTRTVKSYRQIEFPPNLEEGKGPAHFSMALKDENGRNIAEKDAVYFTAHYDESGKLMEISLPIPVKFMGEGKDAIGYIERDGKIYTLPVTKGMYQAMEKEVARNNGLEAGLGQGLTVDSMGVGNAPPVKPVMMQTTIDDSKTASLKNVTPKLEVAIEHPAPETPKATIATLVKTVTEVHPAVMTPDKSTIDPRVETPIDSTTATINPAAMTPTDPTKGVATLATPVEPEIIYGVAHGLNSTPVVNPAIGGAGDPKTASPQPAPITEPSGKSSPASELPKAEPGLNASAAASSLQSPSAPLDKQVDPVSNLASTSTHTVVNLITGKTPPPGVVDEFARRRSVVDPNLNQKPAQQKSELGRNRAQSTPPHTPPVQNAAKGQGGGGPGSRL